MSSHADGGLVAIKVAPAAEITRPIDGLPVAVSITPPAGKERMPVDICCVIDISWSMSMEAKLQAQGSAVESNGLSMLDIAKHAVRTIIRSLDSKDRLSIVQFCRDANIMLEMTEMTEAGQKEAEARLDDIGFGSATNLWAGIEKGFGCLAGDRGGRMGHMILLTDGEVTEGKDQVLPNLKKFKHENKKLPGTICVFGFGYEIDSTMLVEIADFSDGSYAFIPDAGFVGTVFVNCISNLQVTMAQNVILTLETGQEAEISEVLGGWDAQRSEKGTWTISLGTLQYSQTKDIVLRMKIKNDKERYLFAAVEYTTLAGPQPPIKAEGIPPGEPEDFRKAQVQHCRSMAVGSLRQAVASALVTESTEETLKQGQQMVIELADRIKESDAKDDPQVQALLEDVTGQCTEALSRLDYWVKWGRHYIPSVISAHKMEQCNNFKDPGVQFYGQNELFTEMQDSADAHFNTLPAPKITPAQYRYYGGGNLKLNPAFVRPGAPAVTTTRTTNMAAYNDRYAGCIDGAAHAALVGGGSRRISDLAKGDRLLSGLGAEAEVLCVVQSRCRSGRALLIEVSARGAAAAATPLRLTPHHPVFVDGEWRFPIDLSEGHTKEQECEAVYSLVLSGAPAALVDSVPCVALGHGLSEGAAAHPYLGSPRVLEDLQALPGFVSGRVELFPEDVVRDPETGLICGLQRIAT
mmetsp:Transcript_45237/g.113785  ORF Transcript_45237/g.113785 Transcript_45237/m.113785 type:complete len:692 (-) Transcript_45237:228-2303(-)|eukprot:CAMPEP_0115300172 /NCGR_PEP_ID=MMETSP0270-20121206/69191_1 /TAXON_ID=71861 /ORGANISM="Scrippsiella trochoidea, Strain CCMP3099" /LENGTH=691 /DNA_ID=CAMNT_0002717981 /DNA_START=25 /DNA_END=2100 /DNA_ORIENTATION=+